MGVLGHLLKRVLQAVSQIEDVIVEMAAPIFIHRKVGHIQVSPELEGWVPDNFLEVSSRPRQSSSGLPLNEKGIDILLKLLLLWVSQFDAARFDHNRCKTKCLLTEKWLIQPLYI